MCEKSTADFAFVVETRIVYLNAMIERNSNLPIFILHLYFFFLRFYKSIATSEFLYIFADS